MPAQTEVLYKVIFSRKAVKALEKIPRDYQTKVREAGFKLSQNPFVLDVKYMQSSEATHRLRVGPYRLFLLIDTTSKEIIVATIKRRTTRTYR